MALDDRVDLPVGQRARRRRLPRGADGRGRHRRVPGLRAERLASKVHELRDRDAAAGVDGIGAPAPALDHLGAPALDEVAPPRRGLDRGGRAARDQHRGATVRDALPVLGVALDRQAVPRLSAGMRRRHEAVAQGDRANVEGGAKGALRGHYRAILPT